MPLKHFTETVVIVALALVTVLAAILVRTVPPFPAGFVPLLLLFGAGLVYAAALSPMLRRNRADYPLRVLHLAPAAIALFALIFGFLGRSVPALLGTIGFLSFGFFLPLIIVVFVLIALFCLSVLRRRWPRLISLGVILALFVPFAIVSERGTWDERFGATVWGIALPGHTVAVLTPDGPSGSGVLKDGETWGERLEKDLEKRKGDMPIRSSQSSDPSHLPKSGPEMPFIFLAVAGYCAVLQKRAQKSA